MSFSREDILGEFADAAQLGEREWLTGVRISELSRHHTRTPQTRAQHREQQRHWRAKNRDHSNAYAREWRKANDARYKENQKRWRDKNRATLAAKQRARYAADPEAKRALNRAWHARNRAARNIYLNANKLKRRRRKRLVRFVLVALVLHAASTREQT